MGYNVEYEIKLSADSDVNATYTYDRGDHGWSAGGDPTSVPGEGLTLIADYPTTPTCGGEWVIKIENGKVKCDFRSEKFYEHYMGRMLKLLKQKVPSLTGVVISDMSTFWSISDTVRDGEIPDPLATALACLKKDMERVEDKEDKEDKEDREEEQSKKKAKLN